LKANRRSFLEIGGFCSSACAGGLRKFAGEFRKKHFAQNTMEAAKNNLYFYLFCAPRRQKQIS
jgi:hypothetical protein